MEIQDSLPFQDEKINRTRGLNNIYDARKNKEFDMFQLSRPVHLLQKQMVDVTTYFRVNE